MSRVGRLSRMPAPSHARTKLPPELPAACSEGSAPPGVVATLTPEPQPPPALRTRASIRPDRIHATMRSPCALIATAGAFAPAGETFIALPNFPPDGRWIVDKPLP